MAKFLRALLTRPLVPAAFVFAAVVLLVVQIAPPEEAEQVSFADWELVSFSGKAESAVYRRGSDGTLGTEVLVREDDGALLMVRYTGGDLPKVGASFSGTGKVMPAEEATNPGEFDRRAYLRRLGIRARIQAEQVSFSGGGGWREGLQRLRRLFSAQIDEAFGPDSEDGQVLKAMLLGEKDLLFAETKALYQSAGIIHILAISGLHISMLGMGLYRILRKLPFPVLVLPLKTGYAGFAPGRIPRGLCASLSLLLVLLYGEMAGGSASAIRAVIMFSIRMGALLLLRSYDFLSAISAGLIVTLCMNPLYVEDAGFWFSFAAVLSIALVLPAMKTGPGRSVAVVLGTLPVYSLFYFQFPVWSVVLNLLVIPCTSLLFPAGLLVIACQLLFSAGWIPAAACRAILWLFSFLAENQARLPLGRWCMGQAGPGIIVLYIAALAVFAAGKEIFPLAVRPAWLAVCCLLLSFRMDTGPVLWTLDVGQGLCMVLESGDDAFMVDGGSTSKTDVYRYQIAPFLKSRGIGRLTAVLVTHEDWDHVGGVIDLLQDPEGPEVGCLLLPDIGEAGKGENYRLAEAAAAQAGVPVGYLSAGEKVRGRRLVLTCLHPGKKADYGEPNAGSLVLLAQEGEFSALLTGDLEGEGEADYLESLGEDLVRADVLQAAHHGSGGASTEDFLEKNGADIALISCGRNNRYGHPAPETVERLEEHGMEVYDTRLDGAVAVDELFGRLRVRPFLERE